MRFSNMNLALPLWYSEDNRRREEENLGCSSAPGAKSCVILDNICNL